MNAITPRVQFINAFNIQNHFDPRFIIGAKGGAAPQPVVETDTLVSNNTARILDGVSEGEIGGLFDKDFPLKSVFLDDTPVQRDNGSINIDGISVTERVGTPNQAIVPGSSNVLATSTVNVQFTKDVPVVRAITDAALDAVIITVKWPQMYQVDGSGDIRQIVMEIAIDVQSNGGSYTQVIHDTFTGKCSSPYERDYRVNLPAGGAPWNVRTRRLARDTTTKWIGDSYWAATTTVIDSKLTYPWTAYYALALNAQKFGQSIPTRGYEIEGIKCQVPRNYDPVTRVYATTGTGTSGGIWDGTFKRAVTDNPAWIFYDLLTSKRYGVGQYIDANNVDKSALYTIAQYCDELVPKGDGTSATEPRYTFNGVLNTRQSAYNWIKTIASTFRGFTYWGSAGVVAVQDRPGDPTLLVNQTNVIGGNIEYQTSDELVRHTVALVTWNDPANNYKPTVEVVEDPDGIAELGYREIEIAAYGCTSRSLAQRVGYWQLETEKVENELATWAAGFDHAIAAPGTMCKVADPMFMGIRYAGRLASATSTSVIIDQAIDIASGVTYWLDVYRPDGVIVTRELSNAAGKTSLLTFEDEIDDLPQVNSTWTITSSDVSPRQFRIMSLRELGTHQFEVSAIFNDPTKYGRIENKVNTTAPNYSALPTGDIAQPSALSILEYLYQIGPTVKSAVHCSWTPPADPRVNGYEIHAWRPGDDDYIPIGNTGTNSINVLDTTDGSFKFRVRSRTSLGVTSDWAVGAFTLQTFEAPPADVQNFRINILGEFANLYWDAVTDLDIDHYWIKYSPTITGATWGSASTLLEKVNGTSVQVPALTGTYLIKAVDTSGSVSVNAAILFPTVTSILDFDVTETITEDPTFPGTKTGCEVDGGLGGLVISDVTADTSTATYDFHDIVDLGNVYTSRLSAAISAAGVNLDDDFFAPADFFAQEDIFHSDPSAWRVDVEISVTQTDPAASPAGWSEWQPLIVGDYSFRAVRARVILTSLNAGLTPVISALALNVNMPDRVAAELDITSGAGPSVKTFAPAFKKLKGLAITPHNMAAGDYFTVTAKSETGFTVEFFNSSGTPISRVYDYVAKGYGSVVS